MPSAYTSLLGLVQPATGELNGVWGATINAQQTQLVEDAVAGYTTTDVTATDWTLTTTGGGATNQARMSILVATGTPGVARIIYAPKLSKTYVVVNSTDAPLTIKGGPTSPTTGVTVPAGLAYFVAWDTVGGDFVLAGGASNTSGGGATGGGTDAAFYENDVLITEDYTVGQGALIGCTISIAAPAVITQAAHGYVAGQPVRFQTTGALPTGLSTTLPYYVLATGLTTSTFQVSLTDGGAVINTSGTQSGVQSVGKVKNAETAGPVTILTGKTVTVPSGSTWTVV